MNNREKNVRQGRTRWQVVVYEPGSFEGYDDQHIAVVNRCFVTSVSGNTIRYTANDNGYYMSGRTWFANNTESSYRKALKKAKYLIDVINKTNNLN